MTLSEKKLMLNRIIKFYQMHHLRLLRVLCAGQQTTAQKITTTQTESENPADGYSERPKNPVVIPNLKELKPYPEPYIVLWSHVK